MVSRSSASAIPAQAARSRLPRRAPLGRHAGGRSRGLARRTALMKRTFRYCAVIAGLIERRFRGPGEDRAAGDDLDGPRLRRASQARARPCAPAGGPGGCGNRTFDVRRLGVMLKRIRGEFIHKALDRVSPLSVSVMLEIGRERVFGEGADGFGGSGGAAPRRGSGVTALRKNKETTSEIALSGEAAVLDMSGAMHFPEHDTLLVADLHFEKGSSFARRGQMLPPYDTRETLAARRSRGASSAPHGDRPRRQLSRHRRAGSARRSERAMLTQEQEGRDWIWVTGNHDRALPKSVGGDVVAEVTLGSSRSATSPWRHGGGGGGHLHPVGKVVMRGRGAPPLLPHRRHPVRDAGLRRLCGRPQRLRRRLQAALRERLHGSSHRNGAHLRHRKGDALPRLSPSRPPGSSLQSRRKTTLARYPKKRARMAVAAP